MIFSEQGRSRRKSHRRSRMRRWARSGFAILSGFVVLSLAALSLVLANLSGYNDATPRYFSTYSQAQQQPDIYKKDREQRILDRTLAKLNALQSASVEEEEYDTCDSEIDYPVAATEPEREPIIAEREIDQAIPSTDPADGEPGEEVLAQKPADQPQLQNGPSSPSDPSAGLSVPGYPGSAPNTNSGAPSGPYSPRVAGAPRTPNGGSPFGRPSIPQSSIPGTGGGGGAPGTPSAPYISANGPSSGPGASTPPSTPGGQPSGPVVAGNPDTIQPTIDNTPSGSNPIDLPSVLEGPRIGDASDPTDGWFSPGHSPGIATVAGDFNLNGQTLLFEILGTEPGSGYDQLQIGGKANLNEGNIVFAFINGYVPSESDLYDLILGQEILVDLANVNFYYGLFDPANDPSYNLHAPHNLGLYTALDYRDGNPDDDVKLYEAGNGSASNTNGILAFDQLMRIAYRDQGGEKTRGPDQTFTPVEFPSPANDNPSPNQLNTVPEPAQLLLLASGLVLLRRFGKGKTG